MQEGRDLHHAKPAEADARSVAPGRSKIMLTQGRGDAGHLREIIDPDDDVVEDAGLTENLVTVLVFPFSEDIAPLCGWAATPRTRCALSNEGRVDPRDMWTGIIYEPFRAHEVPENRAKVGEEANERAYDE